MLAQTSEGAVVGFDDRADIYRRFALYYDREMTRETPYSERGDYFRKSRDRIDRTFAMIRPHIAGRHVLDIGASPFYLLYQCRKWAANRCSGTYFARDAHPLREVSRIHSYYGPIDLYHSNIEGEALPLADDSVDVVTACEVLEHFEYFPANFVAEVTRVLKPGGLLCITVPNAASIANVLRILRGRNIYMRYRADPSGRHKHEYTRAELIDLMAHMRMEVDRIGYLGSTTSDKAALRPIYRLIARTPFLRRYSPKLFVLARQPRAKATTPFGPPPPSLYDAALSIED
ncbi:MAG: hypothetical protein DI547_06450 [Sphingobium sp.]|nr:MAG: hypothetical protein DI547_06450 [Sphingobium sp.]